MFYFYIRKHHISYPYHVKLYHQSCCQSKPVRHTWNSDLPTSGMTFPDSTLWRDIHRSQFLCRHVFFFCEGNLYIMMWNLWIWSFYLKKKYWQLKLWGYQSVEFICLNMIVFTRPILNNKGALLLPTGRAPRRGSSKWRQVLHHSVELLSNKKPSPFGDKETNTSLHWRGNRLETLISHMAGCQYDCFVTPTCDAIIS